MPGARGSGRGGARDRARNNDRGSSQRGNEGGGAGISAATRRSINMDLDKLFEERTDIFGSGPGQRGNEGGSILGSIKDVVLPDLSAPTGKNPGVIGSMASLLGGPLFAGAMALGGAMQDAGGVSYSDSRVGRAGREARGAVEGAGGDRDRSLLTPAVEPPAKTPDAKTPDPVVPGDPSNVGMRGRRRRQSTILGNVGRSILSPV